VEQLEKELKTKICQLNAYFKADGLELYKAIPREELHQFLIGLMGYYIIPACVFKYERVLRDPQLITSQPGARITMYVISNKRLAAWACLWDSLLSVDASTSMVQVTEDYAGLFYDMYISKHEGKHLTGDCVRILTLTLPFLLRDLIAPEVRVHGWHACYILCYIPCYIPCYILYGIYHGSMVYSMVYIM
jgi:hypothetical protein